LRLTVDELVARYEGVRIDKVVGVEARGFIVGGALAHQIRAGFVPARKQGKLPWNTIGEDYELEYGSDRVEMHTDAIAEGEKVLLVDDLIATGGTALATLEMILRSGGDIVGCCFVIDLPDLGGSRRIAERGFAVTSLCSFEGE
jgi:adenine phosphoribosyltransferase